MYVDCHVHCRDEKWKYKETIAHSLKVAEDSGLDGIFDMPNVPKPVITRKRVLERFALAKSVKSSVFFGVYIGLTPDSNQIKEAVRCYNEFFPKLEDKIGVIGLKMFAGKSVGNLTISDLKEQRKIYRKLRELDYSGVLAVHCEKESVMKPDLWDFKNPITHCNARPVNAEVNSILDQGTFALEEGYACRNNQGKLHIVHVSLPKSVEIIHDFKNSYKYKLNISCGVTFNHLFLSNRVMKNKDGIAYKVNPPLRKPLEKEGLLDLLKKGRIDILESDHAPHSFSEKFNFPYMSGIPSLAFWPEYLKLLLKEGVSKNLIDEMAFDNVNKIFETRIQKKQKINRNYKDNFNFYCFNPIEYLPAKV